MLVEVMLLYICFIVGAMVAGGWAVIIGFRLKEVERVLLGVWLWVALLYAIMGLYVMMVRG